MRDARAWLDLILDPGWVERDDALASADPLLFPGYEPGRESVVAAGGACGGFPVEAIAFDFEVLGGSMGIVAGEKVARAFEHALARRAAVVALTASGGARMQEGMPALAQMAKTVVARDALHRAGLPFVAYLRHPTTGGVYASFGSLADVIWAEPGATVGFAGPRVAETVTGRRLPKGSHTAEFALAGGLLDGVVAAEDLRARLREALDVTLGRDAPAAGRPTPEPKKTATSGWEETGLARHPDRPTAAAILRRIAPGALELRGDRAGGADAGVVCLLARIAGVRCAAIALDRTRPTPAGFRTALRLLRVAGSLHLPVVTLVDTPGADPSSESEAAGVARAIAETFAAMLEHPAPTVSVVTGEGGSGGALAFAVADRLLILEHATFSVIGPEAAAAILKRDDVEPVAEDLRLTAHDLRRFRIADRLVAEPYPGAHADPARTADAVAHAIGRALAEIDPAKALDARRARWREAGNAWLVE